MNKQVSEGGGLGDTAGGEGGADAVPDKSTGVATGEEEDNLDE